MAEKKPPGWNKFLGLARKVVAVPKERVVERIEQARREHPRSTESQQKK